MYGLCEATEMPHEEVVIAVGVYLAFYCKRYSMYQI